MLTGIYDTQCAFMCFNVKDTLQFIDQAQSRPNSMEHLLSAIQFNQKAGVPQKKLCKVYGTVRRGFCR